MSENSAADKEKLNVDAGDLVAVCCGRCCDKAGLSQCCVVDDLRLSAVRRLHEGDKLARDGPLM